MSRCYFGGALLILLLALSLGITWAVSTGLAPVQSELESASQAALREEWDAAARHIRAASHRWQALWQFTASVSDHGPMEAIDGLLAQLDPFLQRKEASAVASLCADLARQVEAISDAHFPSWWNLL